MTRIRKPRAASPASGPLRRTRRAPGTRRKARARIVATARRARRPTGTPPSQARWNRIYRTRGEPELSWHQDEPKRSLKLIQAHARRGSMILDAGAGSSVLGGRLAALGFSNVTSVDLSGSALRRARARARSGAGNLRQIVGDVSRLRDLGPVDIWHDRAAFHFLTDPRDRKRYVAAAARAIVPGGWLILAEFAPDGPEQCSGRPVRRYDGTRLAEELGPDFELEEELREIHRTPWGAAQPFTYAVFRRR